jgi:hypothetical protein
MGNEPVRELLEWDQNSSGFLWISSDKRWRISKHSDTGYSLSQDNTLVVACRSTDDQCKALAQQLQNSYDGVPMLDIATLNAIVNDVVENAMWDVRDAVKSVSESLRDTIIERISK